MLETHYNRVVGWVLLWGRFLVCVLEFFAGVFDAIQFEGIVVSGTEKTRKPFRRIYDIILDRYNLKAEECIFIDDSLRNVEAARELGIHAIQFKNSQQLKNELLHLGVGL